MEKLKAYTTIIVGNIIRDESVPMEAKARIVEVLQDHVTALNKIKNPISRTKNLHARAESARVLDTENKKATANNCTKGCHACCHMNVDLHLTEVPYFDILPSVNEGDSL